MMVFWKMTLPFHGDDQTYDLYPRDTVSFDVKYDKHGCLFTGPVMWTVGTGPRRLISNEREMGEEWDTIGPPKC